MKQSLGFIKEKFPKHICRLRKAPKSWYAQISDFLLHTGFYNSYVDVCLFVYSKFRTNVWIFIYVDDLILTGDNDDAVETIIK